MLYCPKCQQTYETDGQRFCLNDNERLLPAPSAGDSASQTGGVFMTILKRKAEDTGDKSFSVQQISQTGFEPPSSSKIFRSETESESDLEIESASAKIFDPAPIFDPYFEEQADAPAANVLPRLVKPDEIPSGQARLGNRKEIAPNSREAEKAAAAASAGAASRTTPLVRETNQTALGAKREKNSLRKITARQRRNETSPSRIALPILSAAVLLAALLGVWYYFTNPAGENVNQNGAVSNAALSDEIAANTAPPKEAEAPPARSISPPPGSLYFQNSKTNLKGEAVKNYLGFSLYYPNHWRLNEAGNNFLDVSKNADNNLPVEQMLVSYYDSRGTYQADEKKFPAQVKETNRTLTKILPNYQVVSEGKRTINNGWQAYEIKFQGTGKTARGEEVTIWGRRLFIPAAIDGMKNGYVVTMLATSLSNDVKSVEDVGVKGELAAILETFEPNQNLQ